MSSASAFTEERHAVARRLYADARYSAFEAMKEMCEAAEAHVLAGARSSPGVAFWASGSLGRREFLPNSDIDLFVIYDANEVRSVDVVARGADKLEVAQLSVAEIQALIAEGSIDANRVIDGRGLAGDACQSVASMVASVSTHDRQFANLIAEYFYYHYFDFSAKHTADGANLKYSAGSSRATLFFNFGHRILTGGFPATRGQEPELAAALSTFERVLGRRAPLLAIEGVLLAKTAAMSCYYATRDARARYISPRSLAMIFSLCEDRLRAAGINDPRSFEQRYSEWRVEIEEAIERLIKQLLADHPHADLFTSVLQMKADDLVSFLAALGGSEVVATFSALAGWRLAVGRASAAQLASAADILMDRSMSDSWGGVMAIICSPAAEADTLERLLSWLIVHERGAYLTKLITRAPSASSALRLRASEAYERKEVFRTL